MKLLDLRFSGTKSKPFTRKKQLNFTFGTDLPVSDTAKTFSGVMKTHVRSKGIDSIYSNNLTFILPKLAPSKVEKQSITDLTLNIFPNPSSGDIIINASNGRLQILDELGRIIRSFPSWGGETSYSLKLLSGIYFARVEASGKIVTKKIIIE